MTKWNCRKHGKRGKSYYKLFASQLFQMLKRKMFEKNIKKRYFLLFFNILTVILDPKKVISKKQLGWRGVFPWHPQTTNYKNSHHTRQL